MSANFNNYLDEQSRMVKNPNQIGVNYNSPSSGSSDRMLLSANRPLLLPNKIKFNTDLVPARAISQSSW